MSCALGDTITTIVVFFATAITTIITVLHSRGPEKCICNMHTFQFRIEIGINCNWLKLQYPILFLQRCNWLLRCMNRNHYNWNILWQCHLEIKIKRFRIENLTILFYWKYILHAEDVTFTKMKKIVFFIASHMETETSEFIKRVHIFSPMYDGLVGVGYFIHVLHINWLSTFQSCKKWLDLGALFEHSQLR